MKATAYKYLQTKYGKKIVKKVFKILELDKSRPMPIEHVRLSGSTTIALLEVWLHKHTTGENTIFIYGDIPKGVEYKSDNINFMKFESLTDKWNFTKWYVDLSEELDNELT